MIVKVSASQTELVPRRAHLTRKRLQQQSGCFDPPQAKHIRIRSDRDFAAAECPASEACDCLLTVAKQDFADVCVQQHCNARIFREASAKNSGKVRLRAPAGEKRNESFTKIRN